MKTFRNRKTGTYYPEMGCSHWFRVKSATRMEWFERGKGWHKESLSKWEQVEIPDLPKDFTLAQFREHAKTYGVQCYGRRRKLLHCRLETAD